MSDGIRRLARLFVVAEGESAPPSPSRGPRHSDDGCFRAAVVGGRAEALILGCALAGELRRRAGARAALVLAWRGEGDFGRVRTPAAPGAARLASRLARRGSVAAAHGCLVTVRLALDPSDAVLEAQRLSAAAGVPTVLALAGARAAAFDALLAEPPLVVIAAPERDAHLADLARDNLDFVSGEVVEVAPVDAGPSRWLAAAGFGRLAALGGAMAS